MTTYVLIPGMCHGAWCFDDLSAALRAHGHRVLAVTLTGVAERARLGCGGVNLETHASDASARLPPCRRPPNWYWWGIATAAW